MHCPPAINHISSCFQTSYNLASQIWPHHHKSITAILALNCSKIFQLCYWTIIYLKSFKLSLILQKITNKNTESFFEIWFKTRSSLIYSSFFNLKIFNWAQYLKKKTNEFNFNQQPWIKSQILVWVFYVL